MMHISFNFLLLALSALASVTARAVSRDVGPRQGPNTVGASHPSDQTAAMNLTAWLVPVSKAQAQKLAQGRTLLRPTGLPSGYVLGEDQHPLLLLTGYYTDISQSNITAIPQLSEAHVYVPWIQAVASSQTPFVYHYQTFSDSLFASLLGNLFQSANAKLAFFDPPHAAYKPVGASDLSFNVEVGLLPGILATPAFTSTFRRSTSAILTTDFVDSVLQQPVIRSGSKDTCSKTMYLFNETSSNPFAVVGTLTTSSAFTIHPLSFEGAQGLTAAVQWILPPQGQPCTSFA
ncbi:hypothetical protein CF319_g5074 [Tilletia indica]|nr:hypothetical protein CF319_g5074 [Tilletia indica]